MRHCPLGLRLSPTYNNSSIEQSFGETATFGTPIRPSLRPDGYRYHIPRASRASRKVVAKLSSGVRFGVGVVLERACGGECPKCKGTAFERECRLFTFKPHYEVQLEQKAEAPKLKVSVYPCLSNYHHTNTDVFPVSTRLVHRVPLGLHPPVYFVDLIYGRQQDTQLQ